MYALKSWNIMRSKTYVHETYLVETASVCRVMWFGGAYDSYRAKNPIEDQVLGYDVLTSNDASVLNSSLRGMWNRLQRTSIYLIVTHPH